MNCETADDLDREILKHSSSVQAVFGQVFEGAVETAADKDLPVPQVGADEILIRSQKLFYEVADVSPHLAQMLAAIPDEPSQRNVIAADFASVTADERDLGRWLSLLRRVWSRAILSIVIAEIEGGASIADSKQRQTELAEMSIKTALDVMRDEVRHRSGIADLPLSVLALGKLGGRGIDYASDLDLVLVYDDRAAIENAAEVYSRAVELFVTALSGITRDGNLYRVDLRLRPYGKNGASSNPRSVFLEYFERTAAVWELLAFVKLRGVAGPIAIEVETAVREIIHRRALETDRELLRAETVRIRYMLERERGGRRGEVDLKYGAGGLLDIYFATRYLQLRDNIPDDTENRSTRFVLDRLLEKGSISAGDHEAFGAGHAFLSELDHNIRLVTGRSRQLPRDTKSLRIVTDRCSFADTADLLETLSLQRLNVRNAFERVLETDRA
jgi:glutamate-ammonia-ligase adenylyltransferase